MSEPYFADDMVTVHVGDCRKVLPLVLADESVDAVVCDPPYELGFMGRGWDASGVAFDPVTWQECLRAAKPGAHLLAFGGTRTWHRVAVAIEDAGWEIRDTLMWLYGSGFPKSLDVSKAIDKAAGAEREVIGVAADFSRDGASRLADGSHAAPHHEQGGHGYGDRWSAAVTAPHTAEALRWDGWGTALKPGWEPIILARKPLAGTVAQNVQTYGTGALNIDATRVQHNEPVGKPSVGQGGARSGGIMGQRPTMVRVRETDAANTAGRWPTNLLFSHSASCVEDGPCEPDCPVAELDRQSGMRPGGHFPVRRGPGSVYDHGKSLPPETGREDRVMGDGGGASRFFPVFRYSAKASSAERPKLDDGTTHATVKPLDLIRWLTRLITPPGGLVLDPFGGSGTTGEAALIEGFRSILIELEPLHAELIKQRLTKAIQPTLFNEVTP